ncbi:MAG: NAD(P)H-dependent oxidoreductase [Bacteroidia bacterium]|nr:NAD(P)H-dependent oxidoreductase [Bacteroidia bacterium]
MSKKIVAFGASNSKNSINRKLANFAAHQIKDAEVNLLDLNDFEMPIYSIDREKESGIHPLAEKFKAILRESDGILISFAEHNGAYSTAFKNIFDWISRQEKDVWYSKPMFLLATSPGARGGRTVLEIAMNKFKFMNQNTLVDFSLPSFNENFSETEGITQPDMKAAFLEKLALYEAALK